MQVGWDSDDDDNSDDEELEENQLRVDWAGYNESEVVTLDEIVISDKTFIKENLVASKDSHMQSGTVKDLHCLVDLQVGTLRTNTFISMLFTSCA